MEHTGILRTVNRLWNGSTATGDQYIGGAPSTNPNQYLGQLGAWSALSFAAAQAASDSAAAQLLQGGEYQYVQFAADGTNYAVGQALYWKDETNYIVTNVAPTATSANVAGFCLSPVTQGYFWLMIRSGVAYVQYRASVTSTTASTKVYLLVNTNTVDALADATADATAGVAKLMIGVSKDAPSNSGIGRVYLQNIVRVE